MRGSTLINAGHTFCSDCSTQGRTTVLCHCASQSGSTLRAPHRLNILAAIPRSRGPSFLLPCHHHPTACRFPAGGTSVEESNTGAGCEPDPQAKALRIHPNTKDFSADSGLRPSALFLSTFYFIIFVRCASPPTLRSPLTLRELRTIPVHRTATPARSHRTTRAV